MFLSIVQLNCIVNKEFAVEVNIVKEISEFELLHFQSALPNLNLLFARLVLTAQRFKRSILQASSGL